MGLLFLPLTLGGNYHESGTCSNFIFQGKRTFTTYAEDTLRKFNSKTKQYVLLVNINIVVVSLCHFTCNFSCCFLLQEKNGHNFFDAECDLSTWGVRDEKEAEETLWVAQRRVEGRFWPLGTWDGVKIFWRKEEKGTTSSRNTGATTDNCNVWFLLSLFVHSMKHYLCVSLLVSLKAGNKISHYKKKITCVSDKA